MAGALIHVPGLEVPNIDDLSDGDLEDFGILLKMLTTYAFLAEIARAYRRDGVIVQAVRTEEVLNGLYATLPDRYRW